MEVIEHSWVPMADGIRLSVRLWLPDREAGETVPAVLEMIPYRKRDAYRSVDDAWGPVLAAAGIAFARVDVRGTGDSEGVLTDEYSETELQDGEACISWLAARRWCNGAVGMRGISWGGINTLMIAARQPPALKAIVPMAAVANRYTEDAHYVGGRIGKPILDWGVSFKAVLAGPPDPEVVGPDWKKMWQARLAATPAVVTEWLRHQQFDAYWQRGSVCLDPSAIQCPVYLVAGWQDTYVNFIGALLNALECPVQALIGPWGHTYPHLARPQSIDWATEEVGFWKRWLVSDTAHSAAVDRTSRRLTVHLAEQTARQSHPNPVPGVWKMLENLPGRSRGFLLRDGSLIDLNDDASANAEAISWQETEPVGFACAEWLDRLPEEQGRDDAKSLCFDSEPLSESQVLLGSAELLLGASQVSGSTLTARLCDIDPEGRSWLVSYGSVNPGGSTTLAFRMAGHRFRVGHRIRLSLSGGLWPMTWPGREPLQLTLDPDSCRFQLPLLMEGEGETSTIQEKHRQAGAPAALPEVQGIDTDGYRYEVRQDPYEYPVADTGTTLSGEGAFVAELGPAAESRWQATIRRGWRRADWACRVDAEITLERVATGLQITESLHAYQDDELIFERTHSEVLPESVGAD